jgi:hypothetical protein
MLLSQYSLSRVAEHTVVIEYWRNNSSGYSKWIKTQYLANGLDAPGWGSIGLTAASHIFQRRLTLDDCISKDLTCILPNKRCVFVLTQNRVH